MSCTTVCLLALMYECLPELKFSRGSRQLNENPFQTNRENIFHPLHTKLLFQTIFFRLRFSTWFEIEKKKQVVREAINAQRANCNGQPYKLI